MSNVARRDIAIWDKRTYNALWLPPRRYTNIDERIPS